MACVGGVDEKRGRTSGGEGRRYFSSDVAGLTHAGDDQTASSGANFFDGGDKWRAHSVADCGRQRRQSFVLGFD